MKNTWLIPAAIIFAGAIIAIPVYKVNHQSNVMKDGDPSAMRPITSGEHVLGNPAAPVMIVEYADIDSGYTKDFQKSMEQVVKDYGNDGNVAWVFRHFPLIGQDPYSEVHAEAAECAAAQSSNPTNTFFAFIDALQAATPGDSQFNPSDYPTLISSLGLTDSTFESCLQARTYQGHVADDYADAVAVGASGSPYSILLVRGQKPVVISGAIPYAALKKIIDKSIGTVLSGK